MKPMNCGGVLRLYAVNAMREGITRSLLAPGILQYNTRFREIQGDEVIQRLRGIALEGLWGLLIDPPAATTPFSYRCLTPVA
jgi:hypothetical protein